MLEYLLVAGENDDEAAADALIEFVERRATAFATVEADAATGTGSTTSQSVSRKAEAARKPFVNLIPYNPTSAGDKFG
jgi:adenine C2-methylase RlmN of 23S rRNA A2503 and tRNA A37